MTVTHRKDNVLILEGSGLGTQNMEVYYNAEDRIIQFSIYAFGFDARIRLTANDVKEVKEFLERKLSYMRQATLDTKGQ